MLENVHFLPLLSMIYPSRVGHLASPTVTVLKVRILKRLQFEYACAQVHNLSVHFVFNVGLRRLL